MSRLRAALTSSLGKKYVMAITGLLLCAFLVVHLAGNALMLVGPEAYNEYAHALHSREWLVKTAEAGLIVLFAAHLYLAFATNKENRSARGSLDYSQKESKIYERTIAAPVSPDNWMFATGAVVLAFLILHLCDFTFMVRPDVDYGRYAENEFQKAVVILQTPLSFWVYVIGCLVLGWHLGHGVASSFQSLGVNHPRYNRLIEGFGVLFAIVMGVGFAFFPWWAVFLR